MLALFLSPDYSVFTVAFVIMLGIGLIEAIGLGLGQFDLGLDANADADGIGVLDWLGLKSGLPILIWLTSLLGCFTVVGVAVQQGATVMLGAPLHWMAAGGIALVIGGLINRFASAGLARIMPEYESTVIEVEDLIMRRGTVLEGTARRGHPARARVVDQHGQAHYVMVEPHDDTGAIAQGETALLVRRHGTLFFAQPDAGTPFRPI
ncbi:MAG: OB-fold-containig protein [Sphingobium sp.]